MQTPLTASPSSLGSGRKISPELPQFQVALKILEMYVDILCEGNDTTNIKKFARTVTNKVCLTSELSEVVLSSSVAASSTCG